MFVFFNILRYTVTRWVKNLKEFIWWQIVPGVEISVRWPNGWTEPVNNVQTESADPNDHYRPLLTRLCGKQYVGWDWRARGANRLTIKIRKDKAKWATFLAMKWN